MLCFGYILLSGGAARAQSCTIEPHEDSNPVGEEHAITISVLNAAGAAAAGVAVTVEVTSGPNAPRSATFNTDDEGQFEIFYTGDAGLGVDTIEARGTIGDVPFSCTATKTWTEPQPRCAIQPDSDVNPVDAEHQFTVRVTFAGAPLPAISTTIGIVSGPNSPDTRVVNTDANGEIDVSYQGDGGPGTDTIEASGTVNGVAFSCMATKMWVLPPPVCSISPSEETNPVGTRHVLDVAVTRGGVPQSGVGVTVRITAGPNTSQIGTFITAPDGRAIVSYTGNSEPGTDSITASGTLAGISFSCNAAKIWVVPTPTPAATPTPTPSCCVGDCNCDGQVTIDEIVTMVSIAVGSVDVTACPAGDPSGDLAVTVDELLTAITNALDGCA